MKINVKNFHIAKVAEQDGALVYEKPIPIPGLEQVSRAPQISSGSKYGDGIVRFKVSKKAGYQINISHNEIPAELRAYMEGATITDGGIEYGSSSDNPKPFAAGWEVERVDGQSEFTWFLFGLAEPITVDVKQSEDNTNFSSDSISITFMEHDSLKRFYTLVNTSIEKNKDVKASDFFSKVQTKDVVETAV